MKTFWKLLIFQEKTSGLLSSMRSLSWNEKNGSRKNIAIYIALTLCMIPLYATYLITIYTLTVAFTQLDLHAPLFTIIFTVFCICGFLFGLPTLLGRLYLAKDNQFYASLPVPPSTVFAVKFFRVYLTQLFFAIAFILPPAICYYLITKNFISLLICVFFILVVPTIPLLASSLVSILLMPLTKRIRNKDRITTYITLGITIAMLIGQSILTRNIPQDADTAYIIATLSTNIDAILNISGIFPPAAWMSFAVVNSSMLHMALTVLIVVAGILLSIFISNKLYYKNMLVQFESFKGRTRAKTTLTQSKVSIAFFKKEWKIILKTPVYAMNCLTPIIIIPVMLLCSLNVDFSQLPTADIWLTTLICSAVLCFLSGMNTAGSTMITREGKNAYILKLIPIEAKNILKGKLYCSVSISIIYLIPTAIIAAFLLDPFIALLSAAIAMLLSIFTDCLCLLFDCFRPKLDWSNPQYAIKQSLNASLSIFSTLGCILILAIVAIIISTIISTIAAYIFIFTLLLIADIALYNLAITKGSEAIRKLQI